MIFKRYLNISLLIIACFGSSFIALFEGLQAISMARRGADDMYIYGYKNSIIMDISSAYLFKPDDLLKIGEVVSDCNVILEDMYVFFDGSDEVFYDPIILLAQNEELPVPMDIKVDKLEDGCIFAPISCVGGHENVFIRKEPLAIQGRIDDSNHYSNEMRYTMNARTYFTHYADEFDGYNFSIRISSNTHETYDQCSVIEEQLRRVSPHFQIQYYEAKSDRNLLNFVEDDSLLISILLYLFALVNANIITFYWIIARKREIAIRKAFGASKLSIWGKLYWELFSVIGCSAAIVLTVGILVHTFINDILTIADYLFFTLGYIFFVLLATFISLLAPTHRLVSADPIEGVF